MCLLLNKLQTFINRPNFDFKMIEHTIDSPNNKGLRPYSQAVMDYLSKKIPGKDFVFANYGPVSFSGLPAESIPGLCGGDGRSCYEDVVMLDRGGRLNLFRTAFPKKNQNGSC